MASIEVYFDYAAIRQPVAGDVLVERLQDYVPTYIRLSKAIHKGGKLTIIVRQRHCAAWLREAIAKYGAHRFYVRDISRKALLAEAWGVDIPNWVTDAEIQRSGLLELLSLRAQPNQTFENLVLEAFYGRFLTYDRLPLQYLVEFLQAWDPDAWEEADRRPVVTTARRRRLAEWLRSVRSDGERLVVNGIQNDPQALRLLLSRFEVVHKYPAEVGRRVLGERFDALHSLHLVLDGLPIHDSEVRDAADQVEVHLHGVSQSGLSRDVLQETLTKMSGCLVAEFNWVDQALRSGSVSVDRPLLSTVQRTFKPIHERVRARLSSLEALIEPPRPSDPVRSWTADEWLTWAVREYLPYRFWLEEVEKLDDQVAQQADAYADWLYENYTALTGSYPQMVYRAILQSASYLEKDGVVLFIMMDNFNYKFERDFAEMLEARGYFTQSVLPYISMIPSATEISKKSMAIGQPRPFSGTNYSKATEGTWSQFFTDKRVRYIPFVGDLRTIAQREHDLYILNYLPVDQALHDDSRQTGLTHAEAVRQSLHNLAGTVSDFAVRLGVDLQLTVIICSDHGSTLIPAKTPNIIDKAFYADRVKDRHHRFVSISDAELAALPENARYQCYYIGRDAFQLDANYLAARSYYRFVETDANYYVHGGLSPEETVVPFAVFQRVPVSLKELSLRLLANEFRYGTKSRVRVEVTNPNERGVTAISLNVASQNVKAQPLHVPELPGRSVTELVLEDVRISRMGSDSKQLHIVLTYDYAGNTHQQVFELAIVMKGMASTSLDLSSLQ